MEETINGIKYDELFASMIKLDEENYISIPLIISGDLRFKDDVNVRMINELNVKEYLSRVRSNYTNVNCDNLLNAFFCKI